MVTIFFLLILGHFIADYPLQGDFLAKAKSRFNPIPGISWYWAMTAHCMIHAGAVFLITHSPILTALEFIVHFVTDDLKCGQRINFDVDQWIHVLSKLLWVVLAIGFQMPVTI